MYVLCAVIIVRSLCIPLMAARLDVSSSTNGCMRGVRCCTDGHIVLLGAVLGCMYLTECYTLGDQMIGVLTCFGCSMDHLHIVCPPSGPALCLGLILLPSPQGSSTHHFCSLPSPCTVGACLFVHIPPMLPAPTCHHWIHIVCGLSIVVGLVDYLDALRGRVRWAGR
jgi:hypothetical protein